MFDRVTALEIVDTAFDQRRVCVACGAPTVLRSNGGSVTLECSDLRRSGILARIEAFLMPHTEDIVLDLSEGIAA
jgi:hypothetical protein